MSLFGTIKIKERKVVHFASEKAKTSGITGPKKTTIKSLLQKETVPKKLPKLGGEPDNGKKNADYSMNDSFSKYQQKEHTHNVSGFAGHQGGEL